jgi:hypothetical protein
VSGSFDRPSDCLHRRHPASHVFTVAREAVSIGERSSVLPYSGCQGFGLNFAVALAIVCEGPIKFPRLMIYGSRLKCALVYARHR